MATAAAVAGALAARKHDEHDAPAMTHSGPSGGHEFNRSNMNKIHALENEHTHDLNAITTEMRRKSDAQIEVAQRSQVEVQRLTKHLQKLEGGPLVILPTVWWMGRWDTVTSVALLFTAIFTPYEVAMLPTQLNTLFFLNRIIDLVFITDMVRWRVGARFGRSRRPPVRSV